MRLRYLAAAMLCLSSCTVPAETPAESAIVSVSGGVDIIVSRDPDGMWRATPKYPSAYRRWGPQNAAADGITAIEMHAGCEIDRDTLISYNYDVRTRVAC